MNKFGMVLGVAAVATLAGCKDPDYNRGGADVAQNEVKSIDSTPVAPPPVRNDAPPSMPKCTCPPGMRHEKPCQCGDPDCKCVVTPKPVIVADLSKTPPADSEYTIYIVQNGDFLAKISKKFNVTINSIKRLNPSIKNDVVRVGQKLKLPGKIDVGVQETPKTWTATKTVTATGKKSVTSYSGATKEYVVKNGDTLGSIAYGNGINIRQLKSLNNLSSDSLKVGQKLKIPAAKAVPQVKKTESAVKPSKPVVAKLDSKKEQKPVVNEKVAKPAVADATAAGDAAAGAAEEKQQPEAVSEAEPASPVADEAATANAAAATASGAGAKSDTTTTYVVQEGDDMTGISISWGVSAAQIRELNNLGENDQLTPGQIIKLPADAQQ